MRAPLSIIILALSLGGCGSSMAPPQESPVGVYSLTSINGKAPPALAATLDDSVYGGSAQIYSGGQYVVGAIVRDLSVSSHPLGNFDEEGTWSQNGQAMQFAASGGSHAGTYSGGRLTITYGTEQWQFQKQP